MSGRDGFDDASLREELSVFGLSDGEINTYLAVLSRGEAPTSAIAESADVTQRAVYNIAERLEDRELVRVNDHASPTTIRALPPDEAISNLADRLESITPALEEQFNETQPKAPEVQMLKSRETAIKRMRRAISQAENEIAIAIPEYVYLDIEPVLRSAVERGVLVFLLIGDIDDIQEHKSRFADSADIVRCWNESFPLIYAVDDEVAMIGSTEILSEVHTAEDVVSVKQGHLAGSVLGLLLSAYWPSGTEVHLTDPDSLPKTYTWFRQAILHAFLHQRRGADLSATVETTDGEQITGKITEIRQAFTEPSTNDFTLETSIYIQTDDGEVSIGGPGAFMEDYEAESITLRPQQ